MPTTVEEEEGIWPMLDFAVELHREFAEGGSIGSTTNRQPTRKILSFFLGLQTELVRARVGAMRNSRAEGGRKEASERGGLAIPLIGILGSGCSYNSEGQQESTRPLHQLERVQPERNIEINHLSKPVKSPIRLIWLPESELI